MSHLKAKSLFKGSNLYPTTPLQTTMIEMRAKTEKRISKEWNKKLRPSKSFAANDQKISLGTQMKPSNLVKSMSVQKTKAEPMKTVM